MLSIQAPHLQMIGVCPFFEAVFSHLRLEFSELDENPTPQTRAQVGRTTCDHAKVVGFLEITAVNLFDESFNSVDCFHQSYKD